MKVSICIATWLRKTKLKEIIELLEHQSLQRDLYEIIVIDSNSPDGTNALMEDFCKTYNNIKYIRDSKNILATKRNLGIENASGDIIVLMDDDVYPDQDFVLSHYTANENNKDTFYCGQIRFPYELCQKSNYYRFRDQQHLSVNDSNKVLAFNKIVAMNLSFKKEFIEQTGSFDERFVGYGCEDIEFGYRIIQNGYKLEYLEDALAIHMEDCADILEYGKKLYKSGLYGHRVLKTVCPMILDTLYKKL